MFWMKHYNHNLILVIFNSTFSYLMKILSVYVSSPTCALTT